MKPQSASHICRMKQLDFAKHTEADETASILRAEKVKGTSGWREKLIWVIYSRRVAQIVLFPPRQLLSSRSLTAVLEVFYAALATKLLAQHL